MARKRAAGDVRKLNSDNAKANEEKESGGSKAKKRRSKKKKASVDMDSDL